MDLLSAYKDKLKTMDLDIRKTGSSRFIDQKCTPDVLSVVAEAILNFELPIFTIKDIWDSDFSSKEIEEYFQKPSTGNDASKNEYDKFFSQPINLFEYAGIVKKVPTPKGKRGSCFEIIDFEMLKFISIRDRNAYEFLNIYLMEILSQSNLWSVFDNFFTKQDKASFQLLKEVYENFIIKYTPINTKVETRRIFTKVLNPLSVKLGKLGTIKGRLSKTNITYSELVYNRPNFRDEDKPKNLTRVEFEIQYQPQKSDGYYINKAKRQVKSYHSNLSEIHPVFNKQTTTHAHHIFPQNEFSLLADTFENLAVLTTLEHYTFAHPESSTHKISHGYQLVCLLSKLDSVLNSINDKKDGFYSLDAFLYSLEVGLDKNFGLLFKDSLQLKNLIIEHYLNNLGNNPFNLKASDLEIISHQLRYSDSIIPSANLKIMINNTFGKVVLPLEDINITCEYALNKVANLAISY